MCGVRVCVYVVYVACVWPLVDPLAAPPRLASHESSRRVAPAQLVLLPAYARVRAEEAGRGTGRAYAGVGTWGVYRRGAFSTRAWRFAPASGTARRTRQRRPTLRTCGSTCRGRAGPSRAGGARELALPLDVMTLPRHVLASGRCLPRWASLVGHLPENADHRPLLQQARVCLVSTQLIDQQVAPSEFEARSIVVASVHVREFVCALLWPRAVGPSWTNSAQEISE